MIKLKTSFRSKIKAPILKIHTTQSGHKSNSNTIFKILDFYSEPKTVLERSVKKNFYKDKFTIGTPRALLDRHKILIKESKKGRCTFMKKISYYALSLVLGISAANAGTRDAANGLGKQISYAWTNTVEAFGGFFSRRGQGAYAIYDSRKKEYRVIAKGIPAANIYNSLVKTVNDSAEYTVNTSQDGIENIGLVLSFGAADWATATALGIPSNLLKDLPGGDYIVDLSNDINGFVNRVTNQGKKRSVNLVSGSHGLVSDAVSLVTDVATLKGCPVIRAGKYVLDLPGNVLRFLGNVVAPE